ncbi:right-handed parallel beta-helix repeat-containing protein [Cellulosimicrobium protaetiae]|uniref:Right handed beta helix domain-containing protein n=1 Tax=Cellulosimicrobium protaetiae TaxID=2587808 RepID=A0A6M5UHK8_9MICO|nr:right-handed parallel beta-helix repeat-containing protein [Cellulosimicrobium protaetiae]QJW38036.1 hypothetical protein FIC82_019560 [Cellulosimicrobium protaetiae]
MVLVLVASWVLTGTGAWGADDVGSAEPPTEQSAVGPDVLPDEPAPAVDDAATPPTDPAVTTDEPSPAPADTQAPATESAATPSDPQASAAESSVPTADVPVTAPAAEPVPVGPADVAVLADPIVVNPANNVPIAWVGGDTQPPTLVTLQAALNAAAAGDTVHVVEGTFTFTGTLTVPRAVTVTSATPSQIVALWAVTGGGLTTTNLTLSPNLPNRSVVTVAGTGAVLTGLTITNPAALTSIIGINLAGTTGVTITGLTVTATTGVVTAINAASATGVTIRGSTITGAARAYAQTAAQTGAGVLMTDVTVTGATANAVNTGATTGATFTRVTISGTGIANRTVAAIDLQASTGVVIASVNLAGYPVGVSTALTTTGLGPVITGSTVTTTPVGAAATFGITTGATTGARIEDTTVTGNSIRNSVGLDLSGSTGVVVSRIVVRDFGYGVRTLGATTGVGMVATDVTVTGAIDGGVSIGSTAGAVLTDVHVTGTMFGSSVGIDLSVSQGATVVRPVTDAFVTGIMSRTDGTLRKDIPGATITDAVLSGSNGISLNNNGGATITNATIDATGSGVYGRYLSDLTIDTIAITGHAGSSYQNGTNGVRTYFSEGVTVTDAVITGGSTGIYLDVTYDAILTRLTVSAETWYGIYSESATGLELRDSTFTGNVGIANLTINPTESSAEDLTQISRDVVFADNEFTDNVTGIYLPLGFRGFTFERNVVTGTNTYVVQITPAHDVVVRDNDIAFTAADPAFDAAVRVVPYYSNLGETGSHSSSGLSVLNNRFTGTGPFVQIGSLDDLDFGEIGTPGPTPPPEPEPAPESEPDPAPAALAPAVLALVDPPPLGSTSAAWRATTDTAQVVGNVFPADSTAIRTFGNAIVGDDTDTTADYESDVAGALVAVDARDQGDPNDWGSPCRATGIVDGVVVYAGGGARVDQVAAAPALHPRNCIDLTVTEAFGPAGAGPFATGDEVTWTLVPHNDGPLAAPAGWTVTQLLPDGVELVSFTGAGYSFAGLLATADSDLPVGADGPVLTVVVRITEVVDVDTQARNVAYVAPLVEPDATDLDGDGFEDVIAELANPLVVPTLATDTSASPTNNDTEGVWTVAANEVPPTPTPSPTPPTPTSVVTPSTPTGPPASAEHMAATGADVGLLAALACVGIVLGAAGYVLARRRQVA